MPMGLHEMADRVQTFPCSNICAVSYTHLIIAEESKPQCFQKDLLDVLGVIRRQIIMCNEPFGTALQYRLIRAEECLKISFIPALDCLNKICVQIIEPHAAFIAFGKGCLLYTSRCV